MLVKLPIHEPNSVPSAKVPVDPGTSYRPVVLVPNEKPLWGSQETVGKTGAVLTQIAGIPFEVTVYPVDSYFNRAYMDSLGGQEDSKGSWEGP